MKRLRNYALLLPTLFFIFLGAIMPGLASRMQNVQISGLQKKMELSTVDLTLRQDSNVEPVLQLMSQKHTESSWEGETALSKTGACQAALTALETMDQYDLLPEGVLERFRRTQGHTQPQLLVGEDGSSALLWIGTWDDGTHITLDDTTGKAVRILLASDPTDGDIVESARFCLEKWIAFLQDYYEIELTVVEDDTVTFCSSKDGTTLYDLSLEITNDYVFFNYQ